MVKDGILLKIGKILGDLDMERLKIIFSISLIMVS